MNRKNYQTYTSGYPAMPPSYKTVSSGFGVTSQQRTPLYPIGPSLPQPEFKSIQRGTSPYISRQGLQPPSYEQRYHHQTTTGFQQAGTGVGRFDKSKKNF